MWDSGQLVVTPASSGTTSRLPAQLGGMKSPSQTLATGRTFHKAWKISLGPVLSSGVGWSKGNELPCCCVSGTPMLTFRPLGSGPECSQGQVGAAWMSTG